MQIRRYIPTDETGWVRCRVLSFLETAYYDNVLKEKESYENPAIELVAEADGQIVGLIDVEYEQLERAVCSRGNGLGGMIWHIAVHPDYGRSGIGSQLLHEAEKLAIEKGLNRLEAWTRDDKWVNNWYEKNGFVKVDSYYHVFMEGEKELNKAMKSQIPYLHPVQAFAHYTGNDVDKVNETFLRTHECMCFEKYIKT
ncbi:GNAT family N-acetyltransferase [Ornithinibacillus salinisoli]|uniref:GNAT family N-acetyltransferase n=1 Tax=Ornithinibacillus salinisoli TaxID=1848459 RepID=A0ABW4VVK2_9BACI